MPDPIPYGRQWVDEDDVAAVVEVLRSDYLTTGPAVGRFETGLTTATGARHAIALNSGTSALHAMYFAAGIGPGDEIVTSPLTFAATANEKLQGNLQYPRGVFHGTAIAGGRIGRIVSTAGHPLARQSEGNAGSPHEGRSYVGTRLLHVCVGGTDVDREGSVVVYVEDIVEVIIVTAPGPHGVGESQSDPDDMTGAEKGAPFPLLDDFLFFLDFLLLHQLFQVRSEQGVNAVSHIHLDPECAVVGVVYLLPVPDAVVVDSEGGAAMDLQLHVTIRNVLTDHPAQNRSVVEVENFQSFFEGKNLRVRQCRTKGNYYDDYQLSHQTPQISSLLRLVYCRLRLS